MSRSACLQNGWFLKLPKREKLRLLSDQPYWTFLEVLFPCRLVPFFPPPASGVHLAGQHLGRWGVVGQVTFVCHCFAHHTSPREQGRSLAYYTCHRLVLLDTGVRRGEFGVPEERRETLRLYVHKANSWCPLWVQPSDPVCSRPKAAEQNRCSIPNAICVPACSIGR